MHLFPLISDLAIILGVAGLVSLLFQRIKQPVVLGYIIAGTIVGPYTPPFPLVTDIPSIKTWAELGVIFLMFSLGLEFSFRKLVAVGVPSGITAAFEVAFMMMVGYFCGKGLGWNTIDSVFLGAMLSISSTTIIIKALDELKLKTKSFAEMIFAILIVEDLLAILILVALSALVRDSHFSGLTLLSTAFKLVLVVGSWFLAGYFLVPRFMKYVGRVGTNEMLTLISLSLCLAFSVFASYFNYSAALGAFIIGSILAESSESHRIVERLEPLRDLFAAVFFVSVGMLINPRALWTHIGTISIIAAITIVGKIFSTTLGSLLTGQPIRKSIQVGFSLAQIGEFSFIIAGLGMTMHATSDLLYPIGVAVSLVTTFSTPYLIKISGRAADRLEGTLSPQILEAFAQYNRWIQVKQTDAQRKSRFYKLLGKWLLNTIIVTVIFILSSEFLLPIFRSKLSHSIWSVGLSWILTVGISAPFIWAMLTTFEGRPLTGLSFAFRFITLIWIGILSRAFWPLRYTVLLIISFELIFFAVFYRQIERYYRWFEDRFLSTFETKKDSQHVENEQLNSLAPWDAHLVRIRIHPNAELASKSLLETKLRDQMGINVVIIQRGDHLIVAPKPDEKILPSDELLVLGTDAQLDLARPKLEQSKLKLEEEKHITQFELQQIRVTRNMSIAGKTIRHAGIRERFGAMVVGIERNMKRIINPESDLKLEAGDILWIVGEREKLLEFKKNA
jgi:CPA2 family monovalent cation:H+ antiporter-2